MKAAGVFKSLGTHLFVLQKEVILTCYDFVSEGRERPEWLSEYESELDSAIASLRGTASSRS